MLNLHVFLCALNVRVSALGVKTACLLPLSDDLPNADNLVTVLSDGLQPIIELLGLNSCSVQILSSKPNLLELAIIDDAGKNLFSVHFSRMGSLISSGVEDQVLEGVSDDTIARIKSVSRDHQLLQKAETFLVRGRVKARDAYDIKLLVDSGAALRGELKGHMEDVSAGAEFDSQTIRGRIALVNSKLCRADLRNLLPEEDYRKLKETDFEPLRRALLHLFKDWL